MFGALTENGTSMDKLPEKLPAKPAAAKWNYVKEIKLPLFKRRPKVPEDTASSKTFTFEENLRQLRFVQAGQQLIAWEERLFGGCTAAQESVGQEIDMLQKDYEALLIQMWLVVQNSLLAGPETCEPLSAAANAVLQQERQDQRWREAGEESAPAWRPKQCRATHDLLICKMVEERMSRLNEMATPDDLSSPLVKVVCNMGKRLQQDLLKVVRELKPCYPAEFDICKVYAKLYHQVFSERLAQIARSSLDVKDCTYLLCWVNDHYPNDVLKHTEIEKDICSNMLGPLLPETLVQPLEEKYLAHKEEKVRTWTSTALNKELKHWTLGGLPELIDNIYFSAMAIDVIQVVEGAVREAGRILDDNAKAQRLGCQLEGFLTSYKSSLEQFMKKKMDNTNSVLKANLVCIEQFKGYVVSHSVHFPEMVKTRCLGLVTDMEYCIHGYFTSMVHAALKTQYCQLWTEAWFSGSYQVEELLEALESHIEACRDLKPSCLELLVNQLHLEVKVEYVRRMMKGKLRLRDKDQQEKAAVRLCEDGKNLQTFFRRAGSKEEWLGSVLPRMAEVIKLQDPESMKLELVTLAMSYPDLSKRHVSALLYLKANLSMAVVKRILANLIETRGVADPLSTPTFFSSVKVKWNPKIM